MKELIRTMPRVFSLNHTAFLSVLVFVLSFSSLALAAPPNVGLWPPSTIPEMAILPASMSASDSDGDSLTCTWSFEVDPSGQAYFYNTLTYAFSKTTTNCNMAFIGIGEPGESAPSPSLQGETIRVKVSVSDGSNTVEKAKNILVSGLNQKPIIILDTEAMGTQSNPRIHPAALAVNAHGSDDPDGGAVNWAWSIGSMVGGYNCSGTVWVLYGRESESPSITVPRVSATPNNPMSVYLNYRVNDGMWLLEDSVQGYAATEGGCSGSGGGNNTAPIAAASASVSSAGYGEQVNLYGNFSDPDAGDTHSFSWTQIQTSGEPTVTPSSPNSKNTSIITPSEDTTLNYRFTVTDAANDSDTSDVQVFVLEGGGGGGGGDGGGDGGSGSGTSIGTVSGGSACGVSNQPAVATVPATYTISEGFQGQIQASNAEDPDNTTGACTSLGCEPSGVTFVWTVQDGQGLMTTSDLQNATSSTAGFTAPLVTTNTTLSLEVFANDAKACGTRYPVNLVVEDVIDNDNPIVVLSYDVQNQNLSGNAPSSNIVVSAPATIDLDASSSSDPDGDTLTFSWEKSAETLTSGSTVLSATNSTATLTALSGTDGQVTITVTVSDDRGGQTNSDLTFVFLESDGQTPLAVATATKNGQPVVGTLGNGEEISLDGSSSTVPDGTQEEIDNLIFEWTQTSGPQVFTKDLDKKVAKVRITDITEETTLDFQLVVQNGSLQDSAVVQLSVESRDIEEGPDAGKDIVFPLWGVGPLGNGSFLQTTLIIDSLLDEDTNDIRITFYNTLGDVVNLYYLDVLDPDNSPKVWDNDETFTLKALSARAIEFVAPPGQVGVPSGWAWVTSSAGLLRGSSRFQLVDEAGFILEDVAIPISRLGKDFLTTFRLKDEFAFAALNTGDERIVLNFFLYELEDSTCNLPTLTCNPVDDKLISLEGGEMDAMFLEELFDLEELGVEEGHLRVSSEGNEDFSFVGLITRDGVFISAQSISRIE